MRSIRGALIITTIVGVALWGRTLAIFSHGSLTPNSSGSLEAAIQHLDPEYALEVLREMPEDVTALTVASDQTPELVGKVYVGTGPIGSVYSFNSMALDTYSVIGQGLGDYIKYGICEVNTVAIRDLDRDGIPELLATTSQIVPRGRPRLYAWSLSTPHMLRGLARPDIRSSWSHGIGFLESSGAGSRSTYVTYCGYGEIVEFQLASETTEEGFARESLRWKKVGQLPVSGEWVQSVDLDHDGQTEICVATGFATDRAAIHVYAGDQPGGDVRLEQIIDEGGRFFNVRFLVEGLRDDGEKDLVAWWSHEQGEGECEIIRYRMGPEGIRERRLLGQGTVGELWPADGQMAVMDLNGDGHREVWFVNGSGTLYRHDGSQSGSLVRVAQVKGRFGPIAAAPATPLAPAALLLGWGRSVLRLTKGKVPPKQGWKSAAFPSPAVHPSTK